MKRIILLLVLVSILVGLVAACDVDDAESYSCYVIGYTEAKQLDTWKTIADHFGMSVSTLKAMNRGVRLVPGAMIKVAMWTGCPR
jgi:hypothetical protein